MSLAQSDWLLGQGSFATEIYRAGNNQDLIIINGLVRRTFMLDSYFGCYSFKNLTTGEEMLRAIRPEAQNINHLVTDVLSSLSWNRAINHK